MKFEHPVRVVERGGSRPARGGWIEIQFGRRRPTITESRPARGGWIEIGGATFTTRSGWSRPARGGWIEIRAPCDTQPATAVPPRKGRVD